MELTVTIPDDIASRMTNGGADVSGHALELLAAEEYRQGHLYKPDLRRLFGFETSYEIDGFLKAHNELPISNSCRSRLTSSKARPPARTESVLK